MRRFLPIVLSILSLSCAACREEGDIVVHKLEFKGVNAIDQTRLREGLATRQSAKLPWGRKRFFDRSRFDQDLQRIKAFYEDRGYPDATVASFDVKLNDKKDEVDISVVISEGAPVTVVAVEFIGFDAIPPEHLDTLRNEIPLKVNRPRDRQLVLTSRELALSELRDHGFPYAKVSSAEQTNTDPRSVTIAFTAEPGVLAHFGAVQILGNKTVGENVIRRELGYRAGDLYRRSVIQSTQRRLYSMALFQFVNIETVNPDEQSVEVVTKVTVVEGKHQRVNLSGGYGSEEKARVDASYNHVNFFGAARTAGIHGRYSSLDRGLRLELNQPYFFQPRLSLGGEAQHWYTFTPAYQSLVTGARIAIVHRDSAKMSMSLSIASEHTVSSISDEALDDPELRDDLIAIGLDPTTGKQEGTLSPFAYDFERVTADNLLSPRKGYHLAVHMELAGVLLPGTFNYYAAAVDGRHYQPIGDDVVVATRLQMGNIDAAGASETNVPFSKKYFLGGANSLRGWGRYEVSPLSTSGLPLGGNSVLAFSAEARARLKGGLGGVLFLDAGNVWADSFDFALNDLRYAVGLGARYQTPVGPIRLDVGYQLNPIPGLMVDGEPQARRMRFHFSIGQAF